MELVLIGALFAALFGAAELGIIREQRALRQIEKMITRRGESEEDDR